MVEDVEDLPAQLKATRLAETNVLGQRRVESSRGRPKDGVASRVTDAVHSRRRISEAGSIEPLQESMRGVGVRIANRVGACAGRRVTEHSKSGRIIRRSRRAKAQAREVIGNARNLPAAEKLLFKVFLVREERQLVNVVDAQDVTPIQISSRIFIVKVIGVLRRGRKFVLAVRHILRPRVSEIDLTAPGKSALPSRLKTMIVRVEPRLQHTNCAVAPERSNLVEN